MTIIAMINVNGRHGMFILFGIVANEANESSSSRQALIE